MDPANPAGRWTAQVCPTGKRRYLTRADARAAQKIANKRRKNRPGRLSVYRCDLCDGFHMGHLPKPVIRGEKGRDDIYPHQPRRREPS